MRRAIRCVATAGCLTAVVVPLGAVAQQPRDRCGLSSAKGSYGFTETGTIVGFGAYAAVGTIVSDGVGGMRGAFAESADGAIATGITFAGTYRVNADCTGTAELADSAGRTGSRAFVIVQEGNEIQYFFTDAGFVATGTARKQ
jgi:outer membrane lipoprotein SlyB